MEVGNLVMETTDRKLFILNIYRISLPKKIESLKGVKISQISSANGCESLALISQDGKLYTCGYNNYG
jgi:alpha-tubulin suppressor-like RCC1 family protein